MRAGRHRVLLLAGLAVALAACGGGGPTRPAEPRPLAYVALGASDAVGVGAFPPTRGYVFRLEAMLEEEGYDVSLRNLGISGAEAEEIRRDALAPAVAALPALVTLWTGANDVVDGRAPEAFAADLDAILRELRARTGAQVFVADLPDLTQAPLFRFRPDADVTRARVDAFNAAIGREAAEHGAVLVRLSRELPLDAETFSVDGFHPSNTGHERIAAAFWGEIDPRF